MKDMDHTLESLCYLFNAKDSIYPSQGYQQSNQIERWLEQWLQGYTRQKPTGLFVRLPSFQRTHPFTVVSLLSLYIFYSPNT